jgi:hypothetical protein
VTKPAPAEAARDCRGHRPTYTYTAGKNNGQIASSADAITGETVAYQYDSLKRRKEGWACPTEVVALHPYP